MTSRRKVMYLIKGLGLGGAEKLLELGLPYLDRDRFDYEIAYLLPWKDALVPAFEQAQVPVFCLNQQKPYDLRTIFRLTQLLRHREIDILHLHLPYSGILGRLASRMSQVKAVVYTEHNLWPRYHWLTSAANRATYGWNDAVIAVSGEVEHSIRSNYKLNGKPELRTIPNGVDVEQLMAVPRDVCGVKQEFDIPSYHRVVVHVANFTGKKRHEDLLKAAQMVLKEDPDITFLLVGQGPLEAKVKAQARQLKIETNVVFAGFRSDAPRLVSASDLFVLSSQYEGLPISLLEAMALGRPVVVTRVGGIPEVITDGVEGFLVEPLRPDQLAEKVLCLLHSSELQLSFSTNGVRGVKQHFNVQRMVEKTESLYSRLLVEKDWR